MAREKLPISYYRCDFFRHSGIASNAHLRYDSTPSRHYTPEPDYFCRSVINKRLSSCGFTSAGMKCQIISVCQPLSGYFLSISASGSPCSASLKASHVAFRATLISSRRSLPLMLHIIEYNFGQAMRWRKSPHFSLAYFQLHDDRFISTFGFTAQLHALRISRFL